MHHLTNTFEIFGGIHAGRDVPGFDHADADAVGEGTQLLERFLELQRGSGVAANFSSVSRRYTYSPTCARATAGTAGPRAAEGASRAGIGAREKYRASPAVGDDFHDVRTLELFEALERPAQRAHLDRGVGEERRDGGVDRLRLDQRLVALHVDDGAAGQLADRLRRCDRCR